MAKYQRTVSVRYISDNPLKNINISSLIYKPVDLQKSIPSGVIGCLVGGQPVIVRILLRMWDPFFEKLQQINKTFSMIKYLITLWRVAQMQYKKETTDHVDIHQKSNSWTENNYLQSSIQVTFKTISNSCVSQDYHFRCG